MANPKAWHDLTFAFKYIQPLNYRLIILRVPLTSPANVPHEVLRLAMALHLAPVRKAFSSIPVTVDVHIDKLLPIIAKWRDGHLTFGGRGLETPILGFKLALMLALAKDKTGKELSEDKLRDLLWKWRFSFVGMQSRYLATLCVLKCIGFCFEESGRI